MYVYIIFTHTGEETHTYQKKEQKNFIESRKKENEQRHISCQIDSTYLRVYNKNVICFPCFNFALVTYCLSITIFAPSFRLQPFPRTEHTREPLFTRSAL